MTRESKASPLPVEEHGSERLTLERLPKALLVAGVSIGLAFGVNAAVEALRSGGADCIVEANDPCQQ